MKNIKGKVTDLKANKGWVLAVVSNEKESVKFLTKGELDNDKATFLDKTIKINSEVSVTYSKELKAGMYSMNTLLVSNGVTIKQAASKEDKQVTKEKDVKPASKQYSKKDSWDEKLVKITFGNYMNVAAIIVGSTAKASPDPEKVGKLALEMVLPCNTLRNKLLQEFNTKDSSDVGAKLGSAFNAVVYKGITIEKLLEKAEEWIRVHYKYEDMLFNGDLKEKDEPTSDVSSEGKSVEKKQPEDTATKEEVVKETTKKGVVEKGKPERYDFSNDSPTGSSGLESSSFLDDFE